MFSLYLCPVLGDYAMTQQSLITRLKAVEEALKNALGSQNLCPCGEPDCKSTQGIAALSDLRELIKEAEGQREFYGTYTALGEKP